MVRRFFSQALLFYKGRTAAFSLVEFLCFDTFYPLVTMAFYCLLAAHSFRTTDLTRWVVGNAFLLCTNACVFTLGGVFLGERYNGRLRSLLAAPCSKLSVILAGGVFPALLAAATVAVGFLLGGLVFSVDFRGLSWLHTALAILAAMAAAAAHGLCLATFGVVSDSMHLILNVVSYLLMIFTGAEFPRTQLPALGRWFGSLLPLTHAIAAMEQLWQGAYGAFWHLLLLELLVAAAYSLAAWAVFRTVERLARKRGTFDQF